MLQFIKHNGVSPIKIYYMFKSLPTCYSPETSWNDIFFLHFLLTFAIRIHYSVQDSETTSAAAAAAAAEQ